LAVRLVYDSVYIARQKGRKIYDLTYRTIDKYSFSIDYENKLLLRNSNRHATTGGNNIAESASLDQQGCWFRTQKFIVNNFRKYANRIYQWEDDFRFTTIIICTYTIAFVFLFRLTFTCIFLSTTQQKSYISYQKYIFERILNIGMWILILFD
jgi:hypothetical protein